MGKERLASRYKNPKSKNQLEGARKAAIRGARRLWEGSGSAVWGLRAAPVPICLQDRFRRQNSQFHTPRQPVWIAPWPECKNPHRGSFAETNCGGAQERRYRHWAKNSPRAAAKKCVNAAEMRVADFTAPAGSNFACRRKRDDARDSQAAYLDIKSSHARLAKVSTRAGGIFNATKETPKCAIFLKPSDSGERARL